MNIFYVDSDPVKAAQALCNKHVVKMILESAQLLSSVHHLHPMPNRIYLNQLYKLTHKNHPSAIWAREDMYNYSWLYKHTCALLDEYNFRYGKIHKSTYIIGLCSKHTPDIPCVNFTEPPQCMPDNFKVKNDSVSAYRKYYKLGKLPLIDCRWTKREKPDWI